MQQNNDPWVLHNTYQHAKKSELGINVNSWGVSDASIS